LISTDFFWSFGSVSTMAIPSSRNRCHFLSTVFCAGFPMSSGQSFLVNFWPILRCLWVLIVLGFLFHLFLALSNYPATPSSRVTFFRLATTIFPTVFRRRAAIRAESLNCGYCLKPYRHIHLMASSLGSDRCSKTSRCVSHLCPSNGNHS
jgi:hypothetical protein